MIGSVIGRCAATDRPTKITFADCATKAFAVYNCRWPDDARLSDIEPRFICKGCGNRGADVRPNFNWDKLGAPTRAIEPRRRPLSSCV